jgi:subtilase family serine protease
MRVQVLAAALAIVFTGSAIAFAATGKRLRARPDLVVSSLSNPPDVLLPGHGFQVRDRTRNAGRAAAGSTVTRYYLATNGRRTAAGHRAVPRLQAGRSSTHAATVTVLATLKPGIYSLVACADAGGAVRESSERDNCRTAATKLIVKKPPPPV